jgi:hypothetical protein
MDESTNHDASPGSFGTAGGKNRSLKESGQAVPMEDTTMARRQSNGQATSNGHAKADSGRASRAAVLDQTVTLLEGTLKATPRPLTPQERERLRPRTLFPEKHVKG